MMMRDYVCAPLCEEFCFRACVLATVRGAGASAASASAASALVFAGAHAHHYVGMCEHVACVSRVSRADDVHGCVRRHGVSSVFAHRVAGGGDGVSLGV